MKTKIDGKRTVYRLIETHKNGLFLSDLGGFDTRPDAEKRAGKLKLRFYKIETWQ